MKSFLRNVIKRIGTPRALAAALASNGDVPKCVVQLIVIDRQVGSSISNILKKVVERGNEYFSRSNDMVFVPAEKDQTVRLKRRTPPPSWKHPLS